MKKTHDDFREYWRTKYHYLKHQVIRLHRQVYDLQTQNARLQLEAGQNEALATVDSLTGVLNHRATNAALNSEITRSQRYERPFAILFFDLDHFKAINDGFGHAAGDAVLTDFVAIAQCCLRTCDTIGRWGGEEFMALLPETNEAGALIAAERFRATVASYTFNIGGGLHLTCSIGVAEFPHDGLERAKIIASADQAMYAAKHLGRNQVRAFSDPAVVALEAKEHESHSRDEATLMGVVDALALMTEMREGTLLDHAKRVSTMCKQLALALELSPSEAYMLEIAGRLHDIGKIGLPDIVLKMPRDHMRQQDWQAIHQHPGTGANIVSHIPTLRGVALVIKHHHERWDGMGYPDGLAGDDIPLGARIIAVAEAFDEMVHTSTHTPSQALEELQRSAGTQFDPTIIAVLHHVLRNNLVCTNAEEDSQLNTLDICITASAQQGSKKLG